MKFSLDKDASLFGLDDSTDQYQSKLNAANTFSQLRKDLDRNKTLLRTLTPRQFTKRRSNTFQDNVTKLVKGDKESRAILPLLRGDLANPDETVDRLILALYTLTKTAIENIEKSGITDIFPALFSRVVGEFNIFPEMRVKFIDIINDACSVNTTENEQPTDNGQLLLDLLETRKTKRRRLNPSCEPPVSTHGAPAFEPFTLSPEVLVPSEIDQLDIPPDHVPKTVVIQFLEARGERLDAVLADSPMLKAMKVGRQWCWERQRDAVVPESNELRTDSIIAIIPDNVAQDISFILRVGYRAGWEILQYLDFRSSQEQV